MIINLISSPRNISTALMYSFANRPDTKVMDEPYYSYYLNLTGAEHPGKQEIIDSLPVSASEVTRWIEKSNREHEIVFVKNMAHHLIEMDISFLNNWKNVFLIRNPKELIASFSKVISKPTIRDIGSKRQVELFEQVDDDKRWVIDSNEILKDPGNQLSLLCKRLKIPFTEKMISWNPGPLKEDGVWAKYWYDAVHKSNGFAPYKKKEVSLNQHNFNLYLEARPHYDALLRNHI